MFRLTNLADYAVVLMWTMGQNPKELHTAQALASDSNIPLPTTSKILNALARSGLLVSQRGLRGGFKLAKNADEVTVADIVEAVDGPIALTHCVAHVPGECSIEHVCAFRPHWQTINHTIRTSLSGITLQAMLVPPETSGTNS